MFKAMTEGIEGVRELTFRELIGFLMNLAVSTRLDIKYAVSKPGRLFWNYSWTHWLSAKTIARYVLRSKNYCLRYRKDTCVIVGYTEADRGSEKEDRKLY